MRAASAGDFTKQRYLASMEGAVFSGKLAAQAIAQARCSPCTGREARELVANLMVAAIPAQVWQQVRLAAGVSRNC